MLPELSFEIPVVELEKSAKTCEEINLGSYDGIELVVRCFNIENRIFPMYSTQLLPGFHVEFSSRNEDDFGHTETLDIPSFSNLKIHYDAIHDHAQLSY